MSEYGRNINTARCPDCPPSVQTDACYCDYAGAHIVARIAELESLLADMEKKLAQNMAREWPAPASEDEPVEHIKLEVLHEPY